MRDCNVCNLKPEDRTCSESCRAKAMKWLGLKMEKEMTERSRVEMENFRVFGVR